jgi:hypothetical protein
LTADNFLVVKHIIHICSSPEEASMLANI